MNKQITTNKSRLFWFYVLALERIEECERVKGEIISFPNLFLKLCRGFSIKKKDTWTLLFILRDLGFIEIVPYHGVVIKHG